MVQSYRLKIELVLNANEAKLGGSIDLSRLAKLNFRSPVEDLADAESGISGIGVVVDL
jgi:hypothetical protein